MASNAVAANTKTKAVGMGQIVLGGESTRLSAVLGSCVGVILYHEQLRLGIVAHVVLPDSAGKAAAPGKFADTAIPYMLRQLKRHGAERRGQQRRADERYGDERREDQRRSDTLTGLCAKIAGGACMFGTGGPLRIGEANIEAVTKLLDEAGIRIIARDVGGKCGRRISLDCGTGIVTVETVGNPQRVV